MLTLRKLILESDEDFNVTAGDEWNIQELGIGDWLDHNNLKMQVYNKKYEIIKIEKYMYWSIVYLNIYEYDSKNKDWKFIKSSYSDLSTLNDKLKPGFKIQEL